MKDFPLIYCNGDSYSNENFHPSLKNSVYANEVAKHCQGFVINKSISGSCNRRIVRTTLHDMIHQRQLNPSQQIIALISLTFELRSELWIDSTNVVNHEESHFQSRTFSDSMNWKDELAVGKKLSSKNQRNKNKYFDYYNQARAYFFSPYAERINLLTDLTMLKATLDSLNINFVIFQGPRAEKLESDYLLNFFKQQIDQDKRFLNFEQFGFCDWCWQHDFVPLDFFDRPNIAHYGADAHRAFATQVLIPKLQDLNFL